MSLPTKESKIESANFISFRERERENERGCERKCEYYLIKPHNMELSAMCHKQESVREERNIVYTRDLN